MTYMQSIKYINHNTMLGVAVLSIDHNLGVLSSNLGVAFLTSFSPLSSSMDLYPLSSLHWFNGSPSWLWLQCQGFDS